MLTVDLTVWSAGTGWFLRWETALRKGLAVTTLDPNGSGKCCLDLLSLDPVGSSPLTTGPAIPAVGVVHKGPRPVRLAG